MRIEEEQGSISTSLDRAAASLQIMATTIHKIQGIKVSTVMPQNFSIDITYDSVGLWSRQGLGGLRKNRDSSVNVVKPLNTRKLGE